MMLTGILGVGSVCVAPYFPYKKVLHMHCYHVMIEKFSQKQSLILRCQTWLEFTILSASLVSGKRDCFSGLLIYKGVAPP